VGIAAHMYFNTYKGSFPVYYIGNTNQTGHAIVSLSAQLTGRHPDSYETTPLIVFMNNKNNMSPLMKCPNGPLNGEGGPGFHQYGFNNSWGGWARALNGGRGIKVQTVQNPSEKLYAMDWPGHTIEQYFDNATIQHPHHAVPGAGSQKGITVQKVFGLTALYTDCWADLMAGRHGHKDRLSVNLLFVDGHVENRTSAEVTRQYHLAQPTPTSPAQLPLVPNNIFNLYMY
jgi:prepilin-type processing-associated H-X9-DG protein